MRVPPVNVLGLASGYCWTISQGWVFLNGTASDGSTPVLINNANGITVTPAADTGGPVTVRAADTSCGFNSPTSTVSSQSLPASTNIPRTLPTVRIITDRTLSGGNLPLSCGEGGEFRWRAELVGGLPAGGSLSNYQWTISGVAQSFCCLSTAAPVINVTGQPGTGTVGLRVQYCRNGACTTVPVTPVTVSVSSEAVTPVISTPVRPALGRPLALRPDYVCAGTRAGATSYDWSGTDPDFLVSGDVTSNSGHV